MKKVLVTGGCGFIGSHLVHALCNKGYEVHVVDNMTGPRIKDPRAYTHEMDILELGKIQDQLIGTEIVYHLAAVPRVQYSLEYPLITNSNNVDGTLVVLETAKRIGVKRVVFASSSSIYGNAEEMPIKETSKKDPLSPYAAQKLMGEIYCRLYSRVYGLETVCARFFNVYGKGQSAESDYACVIPRFLKQSREGKPLTITGDGEQTRDFTHVSDVVRGLLIMGENAFIGNGEGINLGSGRPVSINAVAGLIGGQKTYLPPRVEPRNTHASIEAAREILNWRPEKTIEEGIAELKLA